MHLIFIFFVPNKSTASIFLLFARFAAHNCPDISPTAKFKIQNHFFLFAYSHWILRIQRIRISEKLGLYDNENVRVLVFDID